MSFSGPANGKCPKCGAPIPTFRIVKHDSKPEALHYYDCEKCGQVLVKVWDTSFPKPIKG